MLWDQLKCYVNGALESQFNKGSVVILIQENEMLHGLFTLFYASAHHLPLTVL